jgi:osmotically-inducible protein OsmY
MLPRRLVLTAVCGLICQGAAFADSLNPVQGSDTEITDRVVHKLIEADADVARRIRVSTLNGVVTLEGTVLSASQVFKVMGDAGKVTGVVHVKNRLHVQM